MRASQRNDGICSGAVCKKIVFALLAFVPFAGAVEIHAEEDVMGVLSQCKTLSVPLERLACFDNALTALPAAIEGQPLPASGTSNRQKNSVDPSGAVVTGIVTQSGASAPAGAERETIAREAKTEPDDFGLEKPRKNAPKKSISSAVLKITKSSSGRLTVELENGQIWRQAGSDSGRLFYHHDGSDSNAVVKKGSFGAYYLFLDGRKSSIRIERVK